jgi:glycosyltransferase involved in cell wall biosynthesis
VLSVLALIKGLGPGGAERLLLEQTRAGGDDVRYEVAYLLDWKDHLVPKLEAEGVVMHCLGVADELDPRWTTRLASLLRRRRFDVVHAHSPVPAAVARVEVRALPRARRPTFIYTEHNRWPSYRIETRLANQATFALNDAVFAVSDDVRDSIPRRARERVDVLVHGVDVDAIRAQLVDRDAVRRELGVAADEVLAVTVANLRADKNYPGLLDTARAVVDAGAPVRFVTCGQGPLRDEITVLHRTSGLGDRFALLGYRDDATRLLAAADLFVLASHHEGLPVSVMEALTLGVPVLAPAVGGLPQVVDDGENGLLVPAGTSRALADAIVRAADPDVRAHLAAGAARTGDRFSAAHAVERIEATYRALTSARA